MEKYKRTMIAVIDFEGALNQNLLLSYLCHNLISVHLAQIEKKIKKLKKKSNL